MNVTHKNLDPTYCDKSPDMRNHPSKWRGRINRGQDEGGSKSGDSTNFTHPTRKARSGNDTKTYRTFAGGESL